MQTHIYESALEKIRLRPLGIILLFFNLDKAICDRLINVFSLQRFVHLKLNDVCIVPLPVFGGQHHIIATESTFPV